MPYDPRFHVVLHQPEIPQNTGNVGRTCVAVDARLWLVRPLGFELDEHHVRRAGLDYWRHLDLQVVENWDDLVARHTPPSQFWYFTKFARKTLWEARFSEGDTLVFGSESVGLPGTLRQMYPDRCIALPMSDRVRSLNLANTVAAGLYEAWRQCGGAADRRARRSPT